MTAAELKALRELAAQVEWNIPRIFAARNALPALLDEIERLRGNAETYDADTEWAKGEIERLKEEIRHVSDMCHHLDECEQHATWAEMRRQETAKLVARVVELEKEGSGFVVERAALQTTIAQIERLVDAMAAHCACEDCERAWHWYKLPAEAAR